MSVKPIPDGYHTITSYLVVDRAAEYLEFLKKAFGAVETFRMPGPDGKVAHAEVRIGDSPLTDRFGGGPNAPRSAMLHLYVTDADAWYKRAIAAGATSTREPSNQFYGDRTAGVKDAWGNDWFFATHTEDVSPEEMERRAKAQR